jgi:hypothetical protein
MAAVFAARKTRDEILTTTYRAYSYPTLSASA